MGLLQRARRVDSFKHVSCVDRSAFRLGGRPACSDGPPAVADADSGAGYADMRPPHPRKQRPRSRGAAPKLVASMCMLESRSAAGKRTPGWEVQPRWRVPATHNAHIQAGASGLSVSAIDCSGVKDGRPLARLLRRFQAGYWSIGRTWSSCPASIPWMQHFSWWAAAWKRSGPAVLRPNSCWRSWRARL